MSATISEKVLNNTHVDQNKIVIDSPTLVTVVGGDLTVTGEDYSVSISDDNMLVITVPGTYSLHHAADVFVNKASVNGSVFNFSGNYIVNLKDCLQAANLLMCEIPLFYLADKLITLAKDNVNESIHLNKKLLFIYQGASIYSSSFDENTDENKIYDALVIGAGPYGVSSSISLKSSNLSTYWVGEPLSFWLRNIQPTELRSVKSATNIYTGQEGFSFIDFCKKYKIDKDGKILFWQFLAYYFFLITSFNILPKYEKVLNVSHKDGLWHVRIEGVTGQKTIVVKNVINATGIGMHPNIPPVFSHLPNNISSHVSQYAIQAYPRNKDIAVIGGAQSAIEYALQVDTYDNNVTMYVRDTLVYRNLHDPSHLIYRYLASNCERYIYYLPEKLKTKVLNYLLEGTCDPEMKLALDNSNVDVKENINIEKSYLINSNKAELVAKGSENIFDKVVVATGYYYDIRNINYLSEFIDHDNHVVAGRFPNLNTNAMLKNAPEGMYFTGFACLYSIGFKSQFINGTNIIIKRILDNINRRS